MFNAGAAGALTEEDSNALDPAAMQILKDGPVFGIARACDMATSTDVPYFEIGAGLLDTTVGYLTFDARGNIVLILSDFSTVKQAWETTHLINDAVSTEDTNSNTEQSNSDEKNNDE